jgi:hypothetical protein
MRAKKVTIAQFIRGYTYFKTSKKRFGRRVLLLNVLLLTKKNSISDFEKNTFVLRKFSDIAFLRINATVLRLNTVLFLLSGPFEDQIF